MLSPTRLRLVNIGVDRPRFPDLTIHLGRDGEPDDVVIMLRNGGGKTTLNSMWLHCYEPRRDKFLAKLAQRHQGKAGKAKEFDHYIPSGSTAYVVCEHVIADAQATLDGFTPRLLVGYAAWKPPNSTVDDHATERFFCLTTTPTLSLDNLPVRDSGGQLLQYDQFTDAIEQHKSTDPRLDWTTTESKTLWQAELVSRGFDLEFIRRFLLKMNLDEGAADRVFTYDGPREFIDSMIDVLADDEHVEQVKNHLAQLAEKAASRDADQATQQFLTTALQYTDPLAEAAGDLRKTRDRRLAAMTEAGQLHLLVNRIRHVVGTAAQAAELAAGHHGRAVDRARRHRRHLSGQRLALHLRLCELQLSAAESRHRKADQAALAADGTVDQLNTILKLAARQRDLDSRQGIQRQLSDLATQAEPTRRQLRVAATVLAARLTNEAGTLDGQEDELKQQAETLEGLGTEGREELAAAAKAHTELEGRITTCEAKQKAGKELRDRLTSDGVLLPEESAAQAASRLSKTAEETRSRAGELRHQGEVATEKAKQLAADAAAKLAEAARLDTTRAATQTTLDAAIASTKRLVQRLTETGYLESEAVSLDDDAQLISAMLEGIVVDARRRGHEADRQLATVNASLTSLDEGELLPPRPEVSRAVATLREVGLSAVEGWRYLSALPSDQAEAAARAHPEVADGIVVTVPEQFGKAEQVLSGAAPATLAAPLLITIAEAFRTQTPNDTPRTVVLPHAGLWNKQEAANAEADLRRQQATLETERLRKEEQASTVAVLLHDLSGWGDSIGPGGIDELKREVARVEKDGDDLRAAAATLSGEAGENEERGAELGRQSHQLELDANTLDTDRRTLEPLVQYEAGLAELERRLAELRRSAIAAERRIEKAKAALESQGKELKRLGERRTDLVLVRSRHRERTQWLDTVVDAYTYPGDDPISPGESAAQRYADHSDDSVADAVRQLVRRFDGEATDAVLNANLQAIDERLSQLDADLSAVARDVYESAKGILETEPTVARREWETRLSTAETAAKVAHAQKGEAGSQVQGAQAERERAERELLDQHGSRADLDEHRKCPTIAATENAISEVAEEIDEAAGKLKAATDAAEVVARDITRLGSRQATLEQSLLASLLNAATTLGASGPLGGAIKLDEIEFDLPDISPIELPQQRLRVRLDGLAQLLGHYQEQAETVDGPIALPDLSVLYTDEVDQLVTTLIGTIESIDRQYRAAESRVHRLVEKLRGCCNTAPAKAAGKVVESLKTATTIELIEQAETFARDAAQRLASVSHALAKFETEIDTTVQIVHVRVQDVRRRIQATARASILPNLPTLGVWAGLPFLKIGWADLGRDERVRQLRLAIVEQIESGTVDLAPRSTRSRPRSALHALVAAVTPRPKVELLIPKVPFDARHYPIEELALRSSGGEGVTAAVIIASLMLAMRRRRNTDRTCLIMDNPFSKVSEPVLLQLMRLVANGLNVQLIFLTPSRDEYALSVFRTWVQLRVDGGHDAAAVVPTSATSQATRETLQTGTLDAKAQILNPVAAMSMTAATISFREPDTSLGPTIPTQSERSAG